MKQKDFWLYSLTIDSSMQDFLKLHPRLTKGSTHMAFAPRNYTRFSENLLFDFDFIYDDLEIATSILSFEKLYRQYLIQHPDSHEPDEFTDDFMYRFLIGLTHEKRKSINGRISLPHMLRLLFEYISGSIESEILFDTGPYFLQLRKKNLQMNLLTRKDNLSFETEEVRILSFDFSGLRQLFDMN